MSQRCPDCGTALPQGVPGWVRQLTVGQVMTANPVTLGPEDTLQTAAETMRRHGVRRIPILLGDKLVGILAEGDLKRAAPSTLSDSEVEFHRVMEGTAISRIMIGQPLTTTAETTLAEATGTLQATKFGALPVLQGGALVGILTDNDLLRALSDLLAHAG